MNFYKRGNRQLEKNETITQLILGCVFSILGTVFLAIGAGLFVHEMSFTKQAVLTQGKILAEDFSVDSDVRMDEDYMHGSTVFQYTFDGNAYISTVRTENSSWHAGQVMDIYVDRNNPYMIRPGGFTLHLLSFIFAAAGSPFLLTGLGFLLYCKIAASRKNDLLENGQKIWATVTGYERNRSVQLNGQWPVRLTCSYRDQITGEVRFYRSGNCWENGDSYMNRQIAVYISKSNPDRYYVDLNSSGHRESV